ncbi:hypothetical protein [Xenorhabdus doucetiae]|uniref:Uncharacterized protein n=1 Tax=Xenorhabdus doucetiae TaxID=351671 RepID=A0A068R094_9GAMM|nr:hypothetical protein [Xenorhabdus doucetiae]TYP02655.1 hypothetical protein LY16_02501 [Xenorhabdus doucetiae]CDG19515.1 conserved protein of unknown function [Xenorhabdus doucetiae]
MSNQIEVSIPSGSSVIIGQRLVLHVTLKSNDKISPDTTVYLDNTHNVTLLDTTHSDESPELFILYLEMSSNMTDGDYVRFGFSISGNINFPPQSVEYTARTLNNDSLRLYYDKSYLDVPSQPNLPPDGNNGESRTRVMARIKDQHSNPIPRLFVFISASSPNDIEKIDLYGNDNSTKIDIEKYQYREGVLLSSNQSGNLIFYVYAKEMQPVTLELYTQVFGITSEVIADSPLHIVNNKPVSSGNYLPAPAIDGFENGGELTTHNQTNFLVNVPLYPDAQVGDIIKFCIDGKTTIYDHILVGLNELGNYSSISLPYNMFQIGVASEFSYLVFLSSGETLYSNSLKLTYTGESWPKPTYYDKCVVYSSFGTNSPNNIIQEADPDNCENIDPNNIVNCPAISQHKNNANDAALFVQITGTNDVTDKTKPPLGSQVKLTLLIKSNPRHVNQVLSKKMPDKPDPNGDGQTAILTIEIPKHYVSGCHEYQNCHAGLIQFSYQAAGSSSSTWTGRIVTSANGADDCDEEHNN